MTIMLMTIVVTLSFEIISYLIQIVLFKLSIEILQFLKIIALETLYNAMLVIILYPVIIKSGEKIEKAFTKEKTLTRYY